MCRVDVVLRLAKVWRWHESLGRPARPARPRLGNGDGERAEHGRRDVRLVPVVVEAAREDRRGVERRRAPHRPLLRAGRFFDDVVDLRLAEATRINTSVAAPRPPPPPLPRAVAAHLDGARVAAHAAVRVQGPVRQARRLAAHEARAVFRGWRRGRWWRRRRRRGGAVDQALPHRRLGVGLAVAGVVVPAHLPFARRALRRDRPLSLIHI